ncbi:MAG: PQQ-binding-like beta-propeller repeat protein [Pirellulaceae bacterium]
MALVLFACPLLLALRATGQEAATVRTAAPQLRVATEADRKDAWPMFRANAARTGYVAGKLASQLHLQWVYQAPHRPSPAWPRSPRMPFDRAYQTVLSYHGIVVFGSSVDNTVYALDAMTGREVWRFVTDGPVRFAPALWRDRVFVASDDGFLYALHIAHGGLLWKIQGGPDLSSILGNQRLISKWPARGGPAVVGNRVYFAAGIWPTDGIYLRAVDVRTGKEVWRNDDSGAIYMAQPHGGANAKSGVSAQGYLVLSGNSLFVPTGRAVPAVFQADKGTFAYFHLQKYGHQGGAPTMAVGDMFFNSGTGFSSNSGEKVTQLSSGQLAAFKDGLVHANGKQLMAYRWVEVKKADRKGKLVTSRALKPAWTVKDVTGGGELIAIGDQVISGGPGRVDMVSGSQQKLTWSATVEGQAYGLAVAKGRLLVSTDAGKIYCFGPAKVSATAKLVQQLDPSPYGSNARYAKLAEEIVQRSGVKEGYCLDLGCGDGALAYELAKRTQLHIYGVEEDPQLVQLARKKLAAAGLYGSRVTVQQRKLNKTQYPKYMADLIVSRRSADEGIASFPREEAERLQRPYGGKICIGPAGSLQVQQRGALTGAGKWTHQYANAANTLNSDDTLLKGRLSMLWFRDVDLDVPQRHGRAPSPLFDQGRLFHQGIDALIAIDAYTGRELWRVGIPGLLKAYNGDELMGVSGTHSNFCVHDGSVYVRDEDKCLRFDAATGELLNQFKPPADKDGKPTRWGYIACVNGILYGSVANTEHVVTYRYVNRGGDMSRLLTESSSLFAMNARTGKLLWHYQAKDSIRHNAIAIDGEKVCLIDRPLATFDREKKPASKEHATGKLVAMDAQTGRVIWERKDDVYGTVLAFSKEHKALMMSYQPTRFRLDSEIGGRISVFDLYEGRPLWEVKADYQSRPMINDRTIYVQGGAWDLLTGKPQPFNFKRSYGCGIMAGSRNLMLFRSATLGYFDLEKNKSIDNYGGMRPGCWVNALPVGGVVLVPDASAGCRCSYLNRAWIALDSQPE